MKVLIIGENTSNIGDLLLRHQLVETVKSYYNPSKLYSAEWMPNPDTDHIIESWGAVSVAIRTNPLKILYHTIGATVLVGPGQMIRDNASISCLLYYLTLSLVAKASGGSFTLHGVGIGKLKKTPHKLLWRLIVFFCTAGYFRDDTSLSKAKNILNMGHKAHLCADYAFLPTKLSALFSPDEGTQNKPYAICAPCHDVSEGRSLSSKTVANLLIEAAASTNINEVTFLVHATKIGHDRAFIKECENEVTRLSKGVIKTRCVETFDLEFIAQLYRESSLVIANRLHAVIFGILARKPIIIPDDGSQKLAPIAEQFGLALFNSQQNEGISNHFAKAPDFEEPIKASQTMALKAFGKTV
jgi:polysaccharide pyruvyl transferase WcaK-like protein